MHSACSATMGVSSETSMHEGDVGIPSFAAEGTIGWMFMAAHIVGSHQPIPCADTQLGNL